MTMISEDRLREIRAYPGKVHDLDIALIVDELLSVRRNPPSGEAGEVTDEMRKFFQDARIWLDSRYENAKPGWMVAQLPAIEAALPTIKEPTDGK